MDEQAWEACGDAQAMMQFLRGTRASGRKHRLFGCACVRRIWHLLGDERSRNAVVIAEQFADGEVTRKELAERDARAQAGDVRAKDGFTWAAGAARKLLLRSARMAGNDASRWAG